ncbi:MAG: hypothetical protein K6E86_09035 [Bacteroidales bacterium]|nr:hypothetical protein [Bacteroidales bacterium]
MKSLKSSIRRGRMYGVLLAMLGMIGVGQADARVRVTKVSSSTSVAQRSLLRGNSGYVYDMFCEGQYALIQRDDEGQTQVYLSASGYTTADSCMVDLDSLDIDWRYVNIYGGMEGDSVACSNVHIKMMSGQVNSIVLRGDGVHNRVTGRAELIAHGGVVDYIDAASYDDLDRGAQLQGWTYVYLSGLKYMGQYPIAYDGTAQLRIFINTDCEFFQSSARYSEDDVCEVQSLVAPDAGTWSVLYAKGTYASIPSGHTVECEELVDSTDTDYPLYVYGQLRIKSCDGWQSSRSVSDFSNVTIPDHQYTEYMTRVPTCTSGAKYVSACIHCGEERTPSFNVEALGHDTIVDAAVAATCWRTGLTQGSHCGRCGEVLVAQDTVAMTSHSYQTVSLTADNVPSCITVDETTNTAVFYLCKVCMAYKMRKGTANHTWVAYNRATAPSAVTTNWRNYRQSATCFQPGLNFPYYCSVCNLLQPATTTTLGHNLTTTEAVEATCTDTGMAEYDHCSRCGMDYLPDAGTSSPDSVRLENLVIPAMGHKYTAECYNQSPLNLLSAATCTEPASYMACCQKCGETNSEYVAYGSPATGHQYRLGSIVGTNGYCAQDGNMTLECEQCDHTVQELPFELCGEYGLEDTDHREGYWCKSKLVSTDTLPTCQDGWGTYQASVCYYGQTVRGTYQNFIPACGYLHKYDADGVCRQPHYMYSCSDVTGKINKDGFGFIRYWSLGTVKKIADDSVYSTNGYVVTTYQVPYYYTLSRGIEYAIDPEDGTQMTYTDYEVTHYEDQESLESSLEEQTSPYYIGTVGGYALDESAVLTAPKVLGVFTHGGALTFTLADATAYGATSDFALSQLNYTRTFSNELWQPWYVPFAVWSIRWRPRACRWHA